jgi:hypothetical protein
MKGWKLSHQFLKPAVYVVFTGIDLVYTSSVVVTRCHYSSQNNDLPNMKL